MWGETSRIKNYVEKMLIALIHELFNLIRDSKDVVESERFIEIIKHVRAQNRELWGIIIHYANEGADNKTPLGKAFLMIRNKIASHYDKDKLFKGYRRKFIDIENKPLISRGNQMSEQRFYFADAAAQEYYRSLQEKVSADVFQNNFNLILDSINQSIKNIVETFIQMRSGWQGI